MQGSLARAHLALGAVVADMGDGAVARAGEERARGLAVCRDLGAERRLARDAHPHQTLPQLGLVLHARGHFLTHIAALAEIHAVQPLEARFEQVAVVGDQLEPALRNEMGHADRVPVHFGGAPSIP